MPDSSSSNKIFGIDLSHHNGAVDFAKVKAAGVKFVILRCGYASTSNRNSYGKDKKFEEYYSAAKAQGLAVGTYFYSMCNSKETGKAEAEFILKTISGKSFEYPVWLDVENTSNLNSVNKETMTDAVETCLETIKAAGYKVGIYTGVYIARDNLVQSRIDKYQPNQQPSQVNINQSTIPPLNNLTIPKISKFVKNSDLEEAAT